MKRMLLLVAACALVVSASGQNLRFASRPSLSPDGETLYFSYLGDIYTVPAAGGQALSLVAMAGQENHPLVSPDGKWLAFSSDINGNQDVYVIPVTGGQARQLTYHEANDFPVSWSPDSKTVYFESQRSGARRTTYRVAVTGGTPQLLFDGYFTTVVNLVENPKDGTFYFNESGESINFPTRKRYVGDHNPDIQSWNPKKKQYAALTDYEGKDTWPMVDAKGTLFYVTDELNKESNIVRYVPGGNPVQLTTFDRSVQYPRIAWNGSKITYLLDYEIHVLDPASGKDTTPQILLAASDPNVRRSFEKQTPSAAAVSPDGKKLAYAIRGFLYVSDPKGKFFQRLATPDDERVHEVVWGSDNKTLYYTRTQIGWTDIFRIAADNKGAETAVYTSEANVKGLTLSHKGDKLAFIDGSNQVMLYDCKAGTAEKVADAEFWSFTRYNLSFSWDDQWLAFDAMDRFEPDIFLYSLADKKLTNLTHSASTEQSPVFSPDGKYLFMIANPTSSSFPRGSSGRLYKLSLQKYDKPFKSDTYDQLFDAKKSAKDSVVRIDPDDIFSRLEAVERSGSQMSPYLYQTKGKTLLLYNTFTDGVREVRALDIDDPEAKPKTVKGLTAGSFFGSKEGLYHLGRGKVNKIDPNSLNVTEVPVSVDVDKTLSDEFSQMFYEVWATLAQNFYDVNFHSADWVAVRDRYAAFLPDIKSRSQLRTLMADLLGELNSSHLGFSSTGGEEKTETKIHSIVTGILFDNQDPYTVAGILPESVADKVEVDVKKGDKLVAVDGVRIVPSVNREKYFATPLQKDEVKLTFSRGGKEFDVKVHTMSPNRFRELQYKQWEDACKARVEKDGAGKIAYIHMRAMGGDDLDNFLLKMHTYAVNRDALILDLRYNNGGNVHQEVIDFLRQKQHFQWSYRDFPKVSHPNVTPSDKPIVVLVNEHSLSDAEVTSNGIQTLDLAKLIGTETYRWIIFTSSVGLIDGSYSRMPAWGCYNNAGQDLEFLGVKPDIYVKNTFKDRITGADPQLDAAIKEVLRQLKK
ncbi:MAG: PD40 domain-containing protein [Bacteroidales bacterium]|nr:PD40 domain-containing protein [Bacteroidales bacterium]